MKIYIENLLPRLKEFSQSLDRKEIFIDTPWITIDENNNKQKYIFQRDGSLIMSLNGEVQIGKWEYLSVAKSILIDRIKDKILLNQYFVHASIMVLKLDGTSENNLILANEHVIPDYNVQEFLKNLYYQKANIKSISLANGQTLELSDDSNSLYPNVSIEGNKVEDCTLEIKDDSKKYEIRNSKISRILINVPYETKKGKIIIEQEHLGNRYGDRAFFKNLPAPDGIYPVGFFEKLYILDGKLTYKRAYKERYNK
jgi:hypothetical protein